MAIQGTPKFDAVVLMEIGPIDFRQGASPALTAKGAFINTISGDTFGQTTCRQFSPATRAKLQELKDAMERDLAELVFDARGDDAPVNARITASDPGGLGEHLRGSAADTEADPA